MREIVGDAHGPHLGEVLEQASRIVEVGEDPVGELGDRVVAGPEVMGADAVVDDTGKDASVGVGRRFVR
ncbi:hypothetical protein ACRS6B_14115 [Nocardia asteroides]